MLIHFPKMPNRNRLILFLLVFCALFIKTSTENVWASDLARADTSQVEYIKFYFNMPADRSFADDGVEINDSWDLVSTLTDLIDQAKYSVDLAIYDLENHLVGEALVRAAERGVRVRVVTDLYNRFDNRRFDEPMWEMLREGGIISMDDSGTVFWPDGTVETHRLPNAGAHMHHKFAVIDMLSDDVEDYYVWSGSMNLTYTGPFNTNLTIVIKDSCIAEAYHEEFEFMWGSDTEIPNPQNARFHRDKPNVSRNLFYINDKKVELYFSPMDRNNTKPSISDRIVELIETEVDHDIAFIAFAITPGIPISQAIWSVTADPDILLNGVIDRSFYGRYRNQGDIWASPEAMILGRSIKPARELRKLHHKTIILDALNKNPDDTAIVITGSYNFSAAAEQVNDENILIIHSNRVANKFIQDFKGIKARARGDMEVPMPPLNYNEWHPVSSVQDGQIIDVEISPGLRLPVSLLGVNAPRLFAGQDTAFYYAGTSRAFLKERLKGAKVRVQGADGKQPVSRFGRYYAYVTAKDSLGTIFSVNSLMLEHGMADYSRFYAQHPDSVALYQSLVENAKALGLNLWENPDMVGERIPRKLEIEEEPQPDFPININTATAEELTALPNIGPARAEAIVQFRIENGPYRTVDDLQKIRGIGPRIAETLAPLIKLTDE